MPATLPDVVARVNGEVIAKADFEQAIRNLEARAGQGVPFEQRNGVYRQMLDQLIGLRLLIQETKVRKVAVTDAEVESQLAQIRKQFPDEAAFKKALTDQRMTLDTLKQETKSQMLVAKVIEAEIASTISVTDGDIQSFYDQNKAQFNEPEAVQASHILIRFPEKADEAARQQARSRADAVLKQVASGGDFAALAREFSEDPGSAAKGGELGFVPKGQTVPAFEAAAFALKPGETSGLVETAFGYHIIKGGQHREARVVPVAEVRQQIQQFLAQQQTQQKTQAFVNQLRAKARVDILM